MMNAVGTEIDLALRSCRSAFASVGLVSLVINLLMLSGPMFMLQVYDRVLTSRSVPTLVALAGIVMGLYAFFGLLEALRARILSRVGGRLDARLSRTTFESTVALPLLRGPAAAKQEPSRDLDLIRQFLTGPGPSALFDLPWLPVYLGIVFLFHPLLGLVASGGALVLCVLIGLNELLVRKPLSDAAIQAGRRNAVTEGARLNAEATTAMGMMPGLRSRWLKEHSLYLAHQSLATDRGSLFGALTKTFRLVLQSAILGIGAYLAIGEAITPGIMIAASIITSRAVAPIEQAVAQWRGFVQARLAFSRLKQALGSRRKTEPETQLPLPQKSLEVEQAFVQAPGGTMMILQGISFRLQAGEGLGIIGPTGAGKSALGRGLVGVWPVVRGVIRLDGADLDQWAPERLGQAIGYLPQDVQLLSGTVAENIARFQADWRSEDVIKAAKLANADKMITRLPDGYDTQVGEAGAILSGGQRQRIALARAVYGDPFLIVLDEPNSNLDSDGERALTQALHSLRAQGCTVIVIAHRPSVIAAVDKLLFIKDGKTGDYGPRDEVLQRVIARRDRENVDLKVVSDG